MSTEYLRQFHWLELISYTASQWAEYHPVSFKFDMKIFQVLIRIDVLLILFMNEEIPPNMLFLMPM